MVRISLLLVTLLFVCVVLQGCGGGPAASLTQTTAQVELPPFPGDQVPQGAGKASSAYSNPQLGRQAWAQATQGAVIAGNTMELSSSLQQFSWAIWTWGAFNTGIVPLDLTVDSGDLAGNEYWLAFSNYDKGTWDIQGPLDGSVTNFSFNPAVNYISASRYTYIALIVAGGNSMVVNQVILSCDQDFVAPAAPRNLTYITLDPTRARLRWLANLEPDLNGYRIYSGPAEDFSLSDPGVELKTEVSASSTTVWINDLTPETEYFFRATAFDAAGNESDPSNTLNLTTPEEPVYPAPTDLQADLVGGYWTDVSWQNVDTPEPLGWEVYTGPSADFQLLDPGVVKRNGALVAVKNFHITGLTAGEHYYCKARTFYGGWSPLSTPVEFTTVEGAPPVPEFTYSQSGSSYLQAGIPVAFDPSPTTDLDTPLSELLFSWDFDNNGTTDNSTTGPSVVFHTYSPRGLYTAKLTVSDGTAVSVTHDLVISFRYQTTTLGTAMPNADTPLKVATWPNDDRVAVLMNSGMIRYYDGSAWSTIPIAGLGDISLTDVALSPDGLHILATEQELEDTTFYMRWTKCDYAGSVWSRQETARVPGNNCLGGSLYFAPNGKFSVGVVFGRLVPPANLEVTARVWHQKADDTLANGSSAIGTNVEATCALQRDNTTSYFVFSKGANLRLWTYTDASNSETAAQTISGSITQIQMGADPADNTHVHWLARNSSGTVYFGDNFGSANGAGQSLAPSPAATSILGSSSLGDNAAQIYWTSGAIDDVQSIMGYDSSADTEFTVYSGLGAAQKGCGASYADGVNTGVYMALKEQRDAEVTGRLVEGQITIHAETLVVPWGDDSVMNSHAALFFEDDSLACFSQQQYPTALAAFAGFVGDTYSTGLAGQDSACHPLTACDSPLPDQYFIAGYPYAGYLSVDAFVKGSAVSTQETLFSGTALPRLVHNATSDETRLFYAANGPAEVFSRVWNGSTWSSAETVYTGGQIIEALAAATSPAGDWSVLVLDDADNLIIIDRTGGVWGAPDTLTTNAASGPAGVGLAFDQAANCIVAYEREGAGAGVYAGIRAPGFGFSFQLASSTTGSEARSINAVFHNGLPAVIFYKLNAVENLSKVWICEPGGGAWTSASLPEQIHGDPLGVASDSNGNVVISGHELIATPYNACVTILYNN